MKPRLPAPSTPQQQDTHCAQSTNYPELEPKHLFLKKSHNKTNAEPDPRTNLPTSLLTKHLFCKDTQHFGVLEMLIITSSKSRALTSHTPWRSHQSGHKLDGIQRQILAFQKTMNRQWVTVHLPLCNYPFGRHLLPALDQLYSTRFYWHKHLLGKTIPKNAAAGVYTVYYTEN